MADEIDIAALYRSHGSMVLGRCRFFLHNDADAQEAMQNVFLAVHRHRAQFRGDSSPSTWLWKTTTHTCLNWLRTRRRRLEDSVDEISAGTNDSMLDDLEARQLIDAMLQDEDETTQLCVIYHYLDGMTHEEAGVLLGLGGAAVRKRISGFRDRARHRFPESLLEVS